MPPGHRAIGLKWVFKLKRHEEEEVVKHGLSGGEGLRPEARAGLRRGIRAGGKVEICSAIAGDRGTSFLGGPPHGHEVRSP